MAADPRDAHEGALPDHYGILGVARDASAAEIKSAYRRRSREVHPDRGGTKGLFEEVNTAHRVLHDPALRAEYDQKLARYERIHRPFPPPNPGDARNPRADSARPDQAPSPRGKPSVAREDLDRPAEVDTAFWCWVAVLAVDVIRTLVVGTFRRDQFFGDNPAIGWIVVDVLLGCLVLILEYGLPMEFRLGEPGSRGALILVAVLTGSWTLLKLATTPFPQGRGKVVRRAPDLGRCQRQEAASRRAAPSSRRRTNRRVALIWAGGEHPSCRFESQSFLQRLGEGAGQDHLRSSPEF
jgi:DnaJ domain